MPDLNDHVWRFRNEQAGDPAFARKPWSEMLMRQAVRIDINALDEFDPVHFRGRLTDDQFDDNQYSLENGDGAIY